MLTWRQGTGFALFDRRAPGDEVLKANGGSPGPGASLLLRLVPTPTPLARVPALDGVRGVAIVLVMIHHAVFFSMSPAGTPATSLLADALNELAVGVDLFFVLSGYLITGILLRSRGRPGYFRNFYGRRTLRIFPLYYAAVLTMCVVLPALIHRDYLDELAANQAWYWAYLPNFRIFRNGDWFLPIFDHTWSLAIEEQFYLVWPMLVLAFGAAKLRPVVIALAVGSLALRCWMATHGYTEAQTRVLPFSHCDGLALGAMLASLQAHGTSPSAFRRLAGALLGTGVALRVLLLTSWVPDPLRENALVGTAWTLVFAGAVAWVAVAGEDSRLRRWLTARPLVHAGTYSYGLYLIHLPIMIWAAPYLGRVSIVQRFAPVAWLSLFCLALGVSSVLALASYHGFEMRFLRLKSRFE